MKKMATVCLLSLCIVATSLAQENTAKPLDVDSFKAGGVPVFIPSPTTQMVEAGYDNREFMEVFVAPGNRLIAAFLLTNDLPKLASGSDDLALSKYAMVQVPRRGEYMDCGISDFKEVTDGAKEEFGDMSSSMQEAEDELNRRMKSLDFDELKFNLGEPVQLGCFFSKPDAYGFGMVMPLSMGEEDMKMAVGAVLMRVRQKLLFVYLYAEYENEETIKWLRETAEKWADAILQENK